MSNIRKRLQKLELRRREEQSVAPVPGDARRRFQERLNVMSLRLQAARDRGEDVGPTVTAEEVKEMIRERLAAIRAREEEEKQFAARRWGRESPPFRSRY